MELAAKWASVEVLSDPKTFGLLFDRLKSSQVLYTECTGQSPRAGQFSVVRDPSIEGKVMEVVYGTTADDLTASIYTENPLFASTDAVKKAREELIEMIEDLKEAAPGRLLLECPVRHRPAELREMTTGALIHILAILVRSRAN